MRQTTCNGCGAALVIDQGASLIAHDELECPAFADALGPAERTRAFRNPPREGSAQWHPLTPDLEALGEDKEPARTDEQIKQESGE